MARTIVDLDAVMLTLAQAIAAGGSSDDRVRGLAWLKEHADQFLDFEIPDKHAQRDFSARTWRHEPSQH